MVAALLMAGLLWLWLSPPSPRLSPDQGQSTPSGTYKEAAAGCAPQELMALSGARGRRERERCAVDVENRREQIESIEQAARAAQAAEQGAIEGYFQARSISVQSVLLFLAFVAALWAAWEARKGAGAIKEQVKLARDEFDAAHRPWIAIREARLDRACLHLGALGLEVTAEYFLENTSETPATDVILLGSLIPRHLEDDIDEIQLGHIRNYTAIGPSTYKEKQTMIVFPGETCAYKSTADMWWRDIETKEELSVIQMRDLLLVGVFFYLDPSGTRTIRYSACAHQITNGMEEGAPEAAKAGTGILLDGKITRWAKGWNAT